jgi:hypothetical protein
VGGTKEDREPGCRLDQHKFAPGTYVSLKEHLVASRLRGAALGLLSLIPPVAFCVFALAAGIPDMVGRWTWQRFTIEVRECADNRICAKVVAGPKNVGMEIFASELTNKDCAWFGDVVNPETGATYRTRMQLTGSGSWRLDGCTASGVCLSGEFIRAH